MSIPTSTPQISPANYRFLREHIHAQVGIVLEDEKHYLLESRLDPLIRRLRLESVNDLCAVMTATRGTEVARELGREVAEAMTTNETYFFRDPAHYEAIRTRLLPRLMQDRSTSRRLRFWSAAASTGQEAYSLAMLLAEEGVGFGDWDITILGTDFSSTVVERARAARFQQIEVSRGLPPGLLEKYFHRAGVDWQLNESLRRMAEFEIIDLRRGLESRGPFDLVFCRNVMIYFDAETKRQILRQLRGTLFCGGWLLLGGAETAFGIEEWFERQTIGEAIVYVAR
jgi:chemotaxis protein methyltransferase CheR